MTIRTRQIRAYRRAQDVAWNREQVKGCVYWRLRKPIPETIDVPPDRWCSRCRKVSAVNGVCQLCGFDDKLTTSDRGYVAEPIGFVGPYGDAQVRE